MKARIDIEKRIEQERIKLNDLKAEISRVESFIHGLEEALKIIPRNEDYKAPGQARKAAIRPGSEIAQIQQLIRQRGTPLHVGEIVVGLGKEDTKGNRMSIAGSLGRYVKKGLVFNRPGPNLFSLIEIPVPSKEKSPPEVRTEDED